MKPSLVFESMKVGYMAKRPIFLWGPPGVGKSDLAEQLRAYFEEHYNRLFSGGHKPGKRKFELRDVRAPLMDNVDLMGVPYVNGGNRTHWAIPEFLPRDGHGIILFDELPNAAPLVQNAMYSLILDRKIGDYELPPGWVAFGAGNRETDKAGTHRMSTALANRFVHVDFEVDFDDWKAWAFSHGIREEVIAYLNYQRSHLHMFDPRSKEKAFPTPRSWEFVSDIMKQKPIPEIELEMYKGTVGDVAGQFLGFLQIARKLPDPDLIIKHPETQPVPAGDPSTMYATCGALSSRASMETIPAIVKYADRFPEKEFAVLMITDCLKKEPLLKKSRPFIEWHSKNHHIML